MKRLLLGAQRGALLAVTGAYRTTSTDALPVLAGVLPLDLAARQWGRLARSRRLGLGREHMDRVEEEGLAEWQARWEASEKGRLTYSYFPCVKESKMKRFLESESTNTKKQKTQANRKYDDSYLQFGFVVKFGSENSTPLPQCVICQETLSNQSMKPSLLKRHQLSKHPETENNPIEFFQRKLTAFRKESKCMSSFTNFNENIVKASYLASLIIAKNGKPHTIGETLVLPAAKEIVRCVLGDKAAKEIEKVSLSNDTVKRRIDDMSSNIKNKLLLYLKDCNFFALQIDESTDITNMAQLMVFIRFDRNDEIIEEFLFCKPLQTHTTSEIIFTTINEYLIEINLPWSKCVGFCSDGARAMTGRLSGVATRIKKVAPLCKTMHCMIHRQALASKNMPKSLKLVLDSAVKIVNLIKARPLNSRLFTVLCNEMGSTHKSLLLHTEVRWLSRGKVLTRLFELRSEILLLLTDIDEEKSKLFCDDEWLSRLAYMADIFDRLNILNLSLQGSNTNMFYASDKVNAFVRKLDLFISQDNSEMKWIINPFEDDYIKNIPEGILAKELFIDLTSDSTLKTAFKTKNITNFWLDVKQEHSALSTQALQFLIPFVSTYLCENTFSH
ncbi:zinc finger BED domain-containing protein 5-like [Melanaphis sacchari]|uniref:zinc finger BED domain-containing protein 5-like n=1 Tax=Melanaphis sacchari TaxID=742174 RepID=UPI000DC1470F|nr:zinc finger BED domain-containing protein 5-like [Melanaphis sacchari]